MIKQMQKRKIVIFGIIMLILVANMCYWGGRKEGYYCDELYSYHFVCQVEYPSVNGTREGKNWLNSWYTPEYFMDYLTITEEEAFDISGTWKSIQQDVHPPIFYLLLEFLCSAGSLILPGVFTKWFGIILNIGFLVLTIIVLFALARRMLGSARWAMAICLLYGMSVGAVSTVVFIRMYMIFTFTCLLFTYINFLLWEGLWKDRKKFGTGVWISLIFTTIIGVLNHYYFLVYAFFVCVLIWGLALFYKRFGFAVKYALFMASGILASFLIWPEMIHDIFQDYRGAEAFANLTDNGNYSEALEEYLSLINAELFGGFAAVLLLFVILGIVLWIFELRWHIEKRTGLNGMVYVLNRKERKNQLKFQISIQDMFFAQVIVSVLLYVLLVAKIAPYRLDRYVFNVYPVICLTAVYAAKRIFSELNSRRFWTGLIWSMMGVLVLIGYIKPGVNYLFKGTQDELDMANDYSMRPAFYITEANNRYRVCGDSLYLSKAQFVYPTKEEGIDNFPEALEDLKNSGLTDEEFSQFLIYIDLNFSDIESVLSRVKEELGVKESQKLFDTEYSVVYAVK